MTKLRRGDQRPTPPRPLPLNVLLAHMYWTYRALRLALGLVSLVLPLALYSLDGGPVRGSLSEYYHSTACLHETFGCVRDIFVGVIVAIGVGLIVYQGFSRAENRALNVAGVAAVVVALAPTGAGAEWLGLVTLHGVAAVTHFLAIGYVAVFRASDTLAISGTGALAGRYRGLYRTLGVLMVGLPLASVVLLGGWVGGGESTVVVFVLETAAIVVFAIFWLAKSYEMWERTRRDIEQLTGPDNEALTTAPVV